MAAKNYVLQTQCDELTINQRSLIKLSEHVLNDGDIIALDGYQMLFSWQQETVQQPKAANLYQEPNEVEFDASNLFADATSQQPDPIEELHRAQPQTSFIDYPELDIKELHAAELNTEGRNNIGGEASSASVAAIEEKLDQLLAISQNPWGQQKQLLGMLDGLVEEFVKEFDPMLIEEMAGTPGMLSGGKQWEAYKKYYERKNKDGHFKRQFKALLIECLQK